MSMNSKICISKKLLLIFLFTIVLFTSFVLISNTLSNSKRTLSSKAAPHEIIGGRDVLEGEFPFIAYLYGLTGSCTGTLIYPEWVLTAAHCVRNDAGYSVNVILDIINKEDMYKIDAKKKFKAYPYIHEGYDPDFSQNDIALLKLDRKAEISPANLPFGDRNRVNAMYRNDANVSVVGWGCVGLSPTPGEKLNYVVPNYIVVSNDKLKVVTLPIHLKDNEKANIFSFGYADKRVLENNVCWGDSGGPALSGTEHPNIVIGLSSSGGVWDIVDSPRIRDYVSWIQKTIKNAPLIPCYDTISKKFIPATTSFTNPPDNSGEYFVYKDCVYDADTKEKTGLRCDRDSPGYTPDYLGGPNQIFSAKSTESCYVPNLSECMNLFHPQIDGYHGRSLDSIVCKINDKGTIPYGETYETKVRDKTLTYKCQCTEREKYPVLQGVK